LLLKEVGKQPKEKTCYCLQEKTEFRIELRTELRIIKIKLLKYLRICSSDYGGESFIICKNKIKKLFCDYT
jgi:hypothetical protein